MIKRMQERLNKNILMIQLSESDRYLCKAKLYPLSETTWIHKSSFKIVIIAVMSNVSVLRVTCMISQLLENG